jgi:hypothetical protein
MSFPFKRGLDVFNGKQNFCFDTFSLLPGQMMSKTKFPDFFSVVVVVVDLMAIFSFLLFLLILKFTTVEAAEAARGQSYKSFRRLFRRLASLT